MSKISVKDGGAVKAAPLNMAGQDGFIGASRPPEGAALSGDMGATLAEIAMLLKRADILTNPGIAAAVDVKFYDINGNPITQIKRGNPVKVEAMHQAIQPLKGVCILVLPVNSPDYKETMLHLREYTGSAVGEWYNFYIPTFVQIEGQATGIVSVTGVGVGFATLTVLP
ncbi:hypothetical protein FJZ31_37915 [Candidatus Poribacteria bacterium]|nr:hypothetical protein [Candidatus Poribacteria bacterium]